ncbi:MAG: phosphoribosylglycinamide formyltransferase [Tannerella sp.]|jgi:phosphoribosylglycinamide formyltransferase-1|nr:phosphoribosylglycinamide formyltransferase [Tannerella sp.]
MKKIAVFASGSGTNAENIVKYFTDNQNVTVVLALSNNLQAGVHARMNRLNIPSMTFSNPEFAEGTEIVKKLQEFEVDLIVLAGFLKMISEPVRRAYPDRIINIHPALLPKYGGQGMYGMRVHEAVVAAGETESGITIHYINEHYDEGQIIFRARCPVLPDDTAEDVANKVHALEYEHYPKVIEWVITE